MPDVWIEVFWALFAIGYGIIVEKHYVSLLNATPNWANTVILYLTVPLPSELFGFFLLYLAIGAYTLYRKRSDLYTLFGGKTYGSLMLAIGLNELRMLNGLGEWASAYNPWLGTEAGTVLLAWIILTVVAHILGRVLAPHTRLVHSEI